MINITAGTPIRMQRVCKTCIHQMQKQQQFEKETSQGAITIDQDKHDFHHSTARQRMLKVAQPREATSSGQETTEGFAPYVSPPAAQPLFATTSGASPNPGDTPRRSPRRNLIKRGELERLCGPAYRKTWERFYFIVLTRKGTVGIYNDQNDTAPAEVIKLAGCTIRIKSERKRPHQFKLFDGNNNTILRLSADSVREMNDWVAAFANAIRGANESQASSTCRE